MSGHKCPFCGQIMAINTGTLTEVRIGSPQSTAQSGHPVGTKRSPGLIVRFYDCPNDECKMTSIYVDLREGSNIIKTLPIHPQVNIIQIPVYVPKAIREDYEEACLILSDSPKASAALCRRCLQGMIRDFHCIKDKKTLSQEIDALKDIIKPDEWSTLDAIRQIGNIGAHMEKDVDLIIDIDPGEAQLLIDTIVQLIDAWYITRHKTAERAAAIEAIKERINKEKGSVKTKVPTASPKP